VFHDVASDLLLGKLESVLLCLKDAAPLKRTMWTFLFIKVASKLV
jgi:hypothetical protein